VLFEEQSIGIKSRFERSTRLVRTGGSSPSLEFDYFHNGLEFDMLVLVCTIQFFSCH